MNILILGAGKVGYNVARQLVSPENQITIVDNDKTILSQIGDQLDIRPIYGHAAHPDVLEAAEAHDADVMIAVTSIDEVNIVACEIVHSLFDINTKIARIRDQNYLNDKHKQIIFQEHNIPIDFVISPEIEVAKNISKGIQIGSKSNIIDILDDAKMVSVKCMPNSQAVNTPLRLIFSLFPKLNISVIAIQRGSNTIIPDQNVVIQQNDIVYFIVPQEQVSEAMSVFGYFEQYKKNVTIAGCGNIGCKLALEIESSQPDVFLKIIESDPVRAENISRFLTNAEIICGDVCNYDILEESLINDCDSFISVTNSDNVNIISALLAKYYNAGQVMSLLSDAKLTKFATSLGIDSIIDPNAITVSIIMGYIKQNKVRTIYSIDEKIEIIEAEVSETSNIVGLSTTDDILIPGQVIVAAVKRGDDLFLFPEKFTVNAGDKLIIVTFKDTVYKIEKIILNQM